MPGMSNPQIIINGPQVTVANDGTSIAAEFGHAFAITVFNSDGTIYQTGEGTLTIGIAMGASPPGTMSFVINATGAATPATNLVARANLPSAFSAYSTGFGFYSSVPFDVVSPGTLAAPSGLTATARNGAIDWAWTAPTGGADSFNFYLGTSSGGESATPVLTGITTAFCTTSGLTNGTTYYGYVKAVTGGTTSAASNEASATPSGSAPPGKPVLMATPEVGGVLLSWALPSGATSVTLLRSANYGGTYSSVYSGSGTSFTDPIGDAQGFYYQLVPYNGTTAGTASDIVYGQSLPNVLQAPVSFALYTDYPDIQPFATNPSLHDLNLLDGQVGDTITGCQGYSRSRGAAAAVYDLGPSPVAVAYTSSNTTNTDFGSSSRTMAATIRTSNDGNTWTTQTTASRTVNVQGATLLLLFVPSSPITARFWEITGVGGVGNITDWRLYDASGDEIYYHVYPPALRISLS